MCLGGERRGRWLTGYSKATADRRSRVALPITLASGRRGPDGSPPDVPPRNSRDDVTPLDGRDEGSR